MLRSLAHAYWRFRHRYPHLPGSGLVRSVRPALWWLLDVLTLERGCKVSCAGRYPLRVEWRRIPALDFSRWESEFITAYIGSLRPDDVVYDVGAEYGEWAALAATVVPAGRVHVFEPNAAAWRHIRKVWRHNRLAAPGGCWPGFVGAVSTPGGVPSTRWPVATGRAAIRFESLLTPGAIPTISLDDYARLQHLPPTVIKMDIEGAEALALEGATHLLTLHRPRLFLSVHPWLLPAHGATTQSLFKWLDDQGYRARLISRDHEEHWYCEPITAAPSR